jgi:diguanylate cyclase (GGDEF)-like protein
MNDPFDLADPASTSDSRGARTLAGYYWQVIVIGTLAFFLVVGWIGWSGWQRQYDQEVRLTQQRVRDSASQLTFMLKAATDEVAQLGTWAHDFQHSAALQDGSAARQRVRQAQAAANGGEFSLDALHQDVSAAHWGQLFALNTARLAPAAGAPSAMDLGVSLLDRLGDGLKTSEFLRWTYFNSAAKDVLVVAPWVAKKDFLGQEPSIKSLLLHSWNYEVATAALPANNPKRQPYWTQAYVDQGGAGLMVSHGRPVYWVDAFVGMVATDIQIEFLNTFLRQFPDPDGTLTISNAQGQILGDRQVHPLGADIKMMPRVLPAASGTRPATWGAERVGDDVVFSASLVNPPWTMALALPQATLNARVAKAYSGMLFLLLVLSLGSVLVNFLLWRMYVAPALKIARFVAHEPAVEPPAAASVPRLWRPWLQAMQQAYSDRQQYFAELQLSYEIMEQRIDERTSALTDANARLEKLAITDALTGSFNRRHLFDLLEAERQRIARGGPTMSVLMMDLDHFKKVNDEFGHAAGDAVLREFVRRSQESVRKTDLVCRYGGEEFVVLMPAMSAMGATQLAQRLRQSVADAPFAFEGLMIQVTVSIGVASYCLPENVEDMLARSDRLLYQAKEAGRNRVLSQT